MPEELTIEDRKAILAKLAKSEAYTRQFHVGDKLEAIDLYNKMDNLYKQTISVEHEVIHSFIFMLPNGVKFTPGQIPERTITSEPTITDITPIVK